MDAEQARKNFWNTLRETLKQQDEPFFFTENKQWAIINKKHIIITNLVSHWIFCG